jgi:hypothetical protein
MYCINICVISVDEQKGGQGNMQDGRQSMGPMGPGMMGMGYGPLNNMMGDPGMMMMGPMGFGQVSKTANIVQSSAMSLNPSFEQMTPAAHIFSKTRVWRRKYLMKSFSY